MNRQQIEYREIDREFGLIPARLFKFEVIVETDVIGTSRYHFEMAHGFDDIGTFIYRKAYKRPGYRWKQYRLFPFGHRVTVIDRSELFSR